MNTVTATALGGLIGCFLGALILVLCGLPGVFVLAGFWAGLIMTGILTVLALIVESFAPKNNSDV